MKTLCSIGLMMGLVYATLAQDDLTNGLARCYNTTAAGGVVVYIPYSTNIIDGTYTILPIRIKMFSAVESNPNWSTNCYFGSKVILLPPIDIIAPSGYMNEWGDPSQDSYSYSHPIIIESSRGGCVSNPKAWSIDYMIMLKGSQVFGCDPVTSPPYNSMLAGKVCAYLWVPPFTNHIATNDMPTQAKGRWGLGAFDGNDTNSQSSVAFIFFNALPAEGINYCGNGVDQDNYTNWIYYPYSCDTNFYSERLYRARYEGSTNCTSTPYFLPPRRSVLLH